MNKRTLTWMVWVVALLLAADVARAAPVIASISPSVGPPFTQVTVVGSGFGTKPGFVTFNGAPGRVVNWSATKIVVKAPDGLAGSGPVKVNGKSNGVNFSFTPTIVALLPSTVKVGWTFAIVGENFGRSPGSATLNGSKLTTTSWGNFLILAKVPPTAKTGPVVVATSVGTSNARTLTVQSGTSPLTIIATATPPPNTNGWNSTNVTVTFTCNGGVAPVQCPPTQTVTTEGANQTITGTATDASGATASASVTVSIDKTPPTITAVVAPPPNATGWNNSNVTVTFTCTDATSGVDACPAPITVSTEGAGQVITGAATDKAGNSATTSVIVNVDKSRPSITAAVTPAPNASGWNNSNVTVTFTCTDATSGIAACPSPTTVSGEGPNQVFTGTASDNAGNSASTSVTINLDKTPPSLTIQSPASGSTISLSTSSITVGGFDSDPLSGIATIQCNGVPATSSPSNFTCAVQLTSGSNSISVQATDVAGNATTSPLTLIYAPAPQVTITAPANLSVTNFTPTTVTGTVNDPSATVTVNGISAPQSIGAFSTAVPLVEGLNVLSAVATNSGGVASTATVQVTLDTTPPHLTIESPADGTTTTESAVTVAGTANDIVVGTVNALDVQVSVNGVPAQVANRTYSAPNVPLSIGKNTIQVNGVDRAGNGTTNSVTVTRVLPSQPPTPAIGTGIITQSLSIVSGNNQTGAIGTQLPAPVVVVLRDPANNPVPNQTVVFKVTGNNGTVSTGGSGTPSIAVPVTTDSTGQAQALWTLGQRSGAGSNSLQASSALAIGPANFTATGLTASAAQIVVDSGNSQTGVLGQPLPFPFVAAVVDAGHNRVSGVPVTFTVKRGGGNLAGASSQTVDTDSNGRAIAVLTLGTQEGFSNNVVEATFAGNGGFPAAFAATAKAPGNPANTTISGLVLDNSNNPIAGATIRLFQTNQGSNNNLPVQIGTPVQTSAQGTFLISSAPVGFFKLMADGTTATGLKIYPTLEYDIVTVAGTDNTIGMPIYLPALDTVNKLCVDETHGGTLTLPQYPGFGLTVPPGAATFPGGSRQGCVTVTPVNGDKVPMAPGFGQQPRFIVTIQPVGTTFNPPAPITLPNLDGLKPKAVTEMYSYDHDLGMFVAIGTGTVSDDGSVIASNPGVGVLKAGWHCGGDPNSTGSAGTCPDCQKCQGLDCVADLSRDATLCDDRDHNECTQGVCTGGNCVSHPLSSDLIAIPPTEIACNPLNPPDICKKDLCVSGTCQHPLKSLLERQLINQTVTDFSQCAELTTKPHQFDGCSVPEWASTLGQSINLFPDYTGDVNQPILGVRFSDVPNAIDAANPSKACDVHDKCYQTCFTGSNTQATCDAQLHDIAIQACQTAFPGIQPIPIFVGVPAINKGQLLYECLGIADLYYRVLGVAGQTAYAADQRTFCQCCPQ